MLAYRIDVYGMAGFRFKSVIACIFAIYIVVLNIALWLSSVYAFANRNSGKNYVDKFSMDFKNMKNRYNIQIHTL